ncbi:Autophagy-related protein 13-like protein [Aphelenchoides fujianensis]|nr:Autophagy-related protein 13-like protein [Aphelenchoides fujianensis]
MSRRDSKPTDQNEADFRKYCRNFCMRFVQVVVSARMGIDLNQPCKPPSQADPTVWFNFKQEEFGEVTAYLKSAIKKYPPDIPVLTVDFFLHTASGDNLPLESWVIRVETSERDKNVDINSNLYRQLGTLLMSVCAAARATPAGRHYTKNQGEKTFVLCYRVHELEPERELLGPDSRTLLLGNYPSPFGSVRVEFNYRTKMELSLPPYEDEQQQQQFKGGEGRRRDLLQDVHSDQEAARQRSRLILASDLKPKAKNWFNPLTDELPFVADMSRARNPTPLPSVESEPAIPAIYQNLPPEVLATMPEELKSPRKPSSSICGSAPLSEFSLPLKKRDSFPFSILFKEGDDEAEGVPKPVRFGQSLPLFALPLASLTHCPLSVNFPANANSSSDSSGSKRYDSDASTTSSIRELVRQKQRKTDELFGFLEPEERPHSKPIEIKTELLASSPLQAFTPPSTEFGPDLEEFVRELSLAPRDMNSLESEDGKHLSAQLKHFEKQAAALDSIVSSIGQD